MIERHKKELSLARQLYKHDNHVVFRIYASIHRLPKSLPWYHGSSIYNLRVQTEPPFSCYITHQYIRDFSSRETAFSITQERVNTISRQFGFTKKYIGNWFGRR